MKFLEAAFDLSIEGHFLFSIPRAFKSRALSTYTTSSIVSYSKLAILGKYHHIQQPLGYKRLEPLFPHLSP